MDTEPGTGRDTAPEELRCWCSEQLGVAAELQALPGDAGFRRYFRIVSAAGRLAVHAPPELEKVPEFIGVAALFRAAGVRVPEVYAVDAGRGFLLLEDLGEELFLQVLAHSPERSETLYRQALELLLMIQAAPREHAGFRLPAYDEAELQAEMALFRPWFVEKLLGGSVSKPEQALLRELFSRLAAAARQGPRVPVHRDYHSRNLLLLADGALATVDFQDAVWGSAVYDLVSLLKDCYARWPRRQLEAWVVLYRELAARCGPGVTETHEEFLRCLDLVGLQRHLKVLGIFARLHLRDGKSAYLRDLPRVIGYVRECWQTWPELADFGEWFERRLEPLLRRQAWMRENAA